jgi:hypothetical protein
VSRLPEKGDTQAAIEMLDARVRAISGGGNVVNCGPVVVDGEEVSGSGADPLLKAYGDLLDSGEFLSEAGVPLVGVALVQIASDGGFQSPLLGLALQAAALGVLMERARWERRP